MKLKRWIITQLWALGLFLSPIYSSVQNSEGRPNIIFIMTDDQGYGDVGYMGHPILKTPNIDKMAKYGLQLDRFYVTSGCAPTRASVLTGRYSARTGVFSWGHALRPQEKTVISHLKEAGYQTAFFGKWHLGSVRAEGKTSPGAHGFDEWVAAPNFYMNNPWMSKNGIPIQLDGEGSVVTADLAIEFIERAAKEDSPFIVFVWTGSPHEPHEAIPKFRDLYSGFPDNLKNYYGEISGIDFAVGRIRDALRELEIENETILWFASDDGGRLPEASNRELRGQKAELWEGGLRVPSVIEWPGKVEPRVSHMPTSVVDLFPTFLELAGVQPDEQIGPKDGVSLVPLMRGEMDYREKPLGFWPLFGVIRGVRMSSDEIVQDLKKYREGRLAIEDLNEGLLNTPDQNYDGLEHYPADAVWMNGDWKLHARANSNNELYNLAIDPREERSILEQNLERADQMMKELRSWQDSVINSIRGEDYNFSH
jgi:arylsulfatase A-like enzyme